MRFTVRIGVALCAMGISAASVFAWDYEGHRLVHELALAGLPKEFPAFVREPAAVERIKFLAGEADRWRNVPDVIMRQSGGSWLDHFLDVEQLPDAGLDPQKVSSLRFDFVLAFAAGRAANADKFPAIDPAKNADHTQEWPGFAPWAVTEYVAKLKSGFSYLRTFQENGGTPTEIANAEANIVYIMGVLGHYVADIAQPLHTTNHHNGWVGPNPQGYTTWAGLHSWIDGGFMQKIGLNGEELMPQARPARLLPLTPSATDGRDPVFVQVMAYLLAQHAQVVPLYELEKAGKFKADGPPGAPEGRAFIGNQILTAGEMLGSLWVTAWRTAGPDTYLRSQLIKRQTAAASAK